MSPSKWKMVCVLTGLALAVGPSVLNGQSSGSTAEVRLGSGLGPVGWDSTLSAEYWPVFKVRAPLGTGAGQSEEYRLRSDRSPPIGPLLHTLSAPAHWGGRDLLTIGIVAATTGAAVLVEESLFEYLNENKSGSVNALERIGDIYGTPLFTGSVSLVTYGSGLLFHSTPVKETGLMMVEALLLTAAVQQPLRLAVGRARPLTGEGHLSFDPFTTANEYAAFISGHTWSAMALSTIISRQVGNPWVSVLAYSLAGVTAGSRLYAGKHWLSDVIIGGAAGYFTATTIWRWHKARVVAGSKLSLLLSPNGFVVNASF
jgi:membrane-associated phospholipid phosphatase